MGFTMSLCLVVDDSKVVRTIAKRMIEPMGYKVIEAGDGKEALDKCASELPDFILLDWNMPVMDGMEFLKTFRNVHNGENTKIIFCTTEIELAQILKAMEAGADEYIMKPFDEAILRDKMMQIGLISS